MEQKEIKMTQRGLIRERERTWLRKGNVEWERGRYWDIENWEREWERLRIVRERKKQLTSESVYNA